MTNLQDNNLLLGYNTSGNYVIASDRDVAVFINDAAAEMIGFDMIGEPICDIIGEDIRMLASQIQESGTITIADCDFFGRRCTLNLFTGTPMLYVYTPSQNQKTEQETPFSPLSLLGLTSELRRHLVPILFSGQDTSPTITKSGYQLVRLINNFSDYINLTSDSPMLFCADTDVVELCRDVVASVKPILAIKDIPIRFDSHSSSCLLSADPQLIRRILYNLIANAAKYTRDGNQIQIRLNCTSTQCFIVVSDRGTGIQEEDISDIFRSHEAIDFPHLEGGYGLGLALVRKIATLHGGSAALETKEGIGTNVTISLPIKRTRGLTYREILLGDSFNMALLELSDILTPAEFAAARLLLEE